MIRVLGVNVGENEHIGLGAHQSIDIQGPRQITLIKREFD
jgi:stalled ribosome rescue protein Dom34